MHFLTSVLLFLFNLFSTDLKSFSLVLYDGIQISVYSIFTREFTIFIKQCNRPILLKRSSQLPVIERKVDPMKSLIGG